MPQVSRKLGVEEARKMLSVERASEIDRQRKELGKWPGHYNLKLLAQAVNSRKLFVTFLNGEENELFVIRYDDNRKAVFIRPDSKHYFVPAGWFPYDKLKYILKENNDAQPS